MFVEYRGRGDGNCLQEREKARLKKLERETAQKEFRVLNSLGFSR